MALGKLRFAERVTLALTVFIAASGVGITAVTAYRFRTELCQRDQSAAFTVYLAAANYLSAHYKTHHATYYRRSLDFVFSQKFLALDGEAGTRVIHRPVHLSVYATNGVLQYEFSGAGVRGAPRHLSPAELPARFSLRMNLPDATIRVAGPVSPDGDVPGYIFLTCPTDISTKLAALYRDSFLFMLFIVFVAVGVSILLTRPMLGSVEQLVQAARRVRAGDFASRVRVKGKDEIAVFAATFNDMVASLGRRIDLLKRMQVWTMELSRIFDVRDLYQHFMDLCASLSGAQAFRLYLQDAPGDPVRMVLARDTGAEPAVCDELLVHEAFRGGRLASRRNAWGPAPEESGPVELAIPMMSGKNQVGVMWIGPPRDRQSYDDETVTILETLAHHAAVAVENARLYKEVAEKERYEREMTLARQIQAGMLPRDVPVIKGYNVFGVCMPAYEVGGDYFDYIPGSGSRWHFILGDVSGKGVAAALIVSILHSLVHTYVHRESSPRQILNWVNRNLIPDLKLDMFVTLVSATLDPEQHVARIVRAGHEPALLVRGSGEVLKLIPRGAALGIVEVPTFEHALQETQIPMREGDTLLFYTDGVTEAFSGTGEEFGYDRILEAARRHAGRSARELVEAIVGEVKSFLGNETPQDDITVLAIRRDGDAARSA